MKTNDYTNLKYAVLAVQHPQLRRQVEQAPVNLQESVEMETEQEVHPVVNAITNIIADAEHRLGIQFTAEEIEYCTNYISENIRAVALVEAVEEQVGFDLNEEEVAYLFNTVEQLLS